MEPNKTDTAAYLAGSDCLVVPAYQRTYEWSDARWGDLWRDLSILHHRANAKIRDEGMDLEDPELIAPHHFMGTVILSLHRILGGGRGNEYLVIDWQQRMLTLFLLAAAIRDQEAFTEGRTIDRSDLLGVIPPQIPGDPSLERVRAQEEDRAAFTSCMAGEFLSSVPDLHVRSPIAQCYMFFRYQLWRGVAAMDDYEVIAPPRPRRGRRCPASRFV